MESNQVGIIGWIKTAIIDVGAIGKNGSGLCFKEEHNGQYGG